MSKENVKSANDLPEELRSALDAYRKDGSAKSWTALSQLYVSDDVEVLDAVQRLDPDFPEPLAVPVDGLVEDNADFFQWPQLPDPDDVLRAILDVLQR